MRFSLGATMLELFLWAALILVAIAKVSYELWSYLEESER